MSTRQLTAHRGVVCAVYHLGLPIFAIAVVASWPPLMMAGIRFPRCRRAVAGVATATGHKLPARRPLLNAALIGGCLRLATADAG